MNNVIQFPQAQEAARSINVDAASLMFVLPHQLREHLVNSLAWPDPTLLIRVYCAVAGGLLQTDLSETEARAMGWASLEAAKDRGLAILELIHTLPPPSSSQA